MERNGHFVEGVVLMILVVAFTIFLYVPGKGSSLMSRHEREIIRKSDSVMYVLTVNDPDDSVVLRSKCVNFTDKELSSHAYSVLVKKMMNTVQAPQQGGVGLAAPQVGLGHRVIIVCRMDKEGEPYEAYPNIRIDSLYGETSLGPEGCLSIPPYRGDVPRYSAVDIVYRDARAQKDIKEHVTGYTAIVFQHECDHLDGILYTDRADSVFVDESWREERKEYEAKGLYDKPSWMKN